VQLLQTHGRLLLLLLLLLPPRNGRWPHDGGRHAQQQPLLS
jgi:hypothetical protein